MSGGGGGYSPSYEPSGSGDSCKDLVFTTNLSSPDPAVVSTLKRGDTLEIVITPTRSIELHNANGEVAGALLTNYRDRLINCIELGTDFEGTVIEITGGNIKVKIHPK